MRKQSVLLAVICAVLATGSANAQHLTDRFDDLLLNTANNTPGFAKDLQEFHADIDARVQAMNAAKANSAAKTTASRGTIPIVFHIVLDSGKMKQLGDIQQIEQRIKGQLEVLNTDFNAQNADASGIPGVFQPLYTSLNVNFALAHTAPDGKYTKGYEIVYTSKTGFDENNLTMGSKFACSDVKFGASGGAEAWDTKKYYNIWITHILPSGIGGMGTPPPYAIYGGLQLLPYNEQGTVITYMAFGKKEGSQFFPVPSAQVGRTLVHETGHFFNLFHPFGMSTFDNSNCQDDDGVTDTPPQVAPSFGKPTFPLVDGCSPASPGVMWMNHMDYADDVTRLMFSKEQTDRMAVEFEPGGYRYELLQHPQLLQTPAGVTHIEMNKPLHIWPNPVRHILNISFDKAAANGELVIINSIGQLVLKTTITGGTNQQVDMNSYPAGTYIVRYTSAEGVVTEKFSKQ